MSIYGNFSFIFLEIPRDYYHAFIFVSVMIVTWDPANNTTKIPCVDVVL